LKPIRPASGYRTALLRTLAAAALLAAFVLLSGSEPAARALAYAVTQMSGGQIVIQGVSGSLYSRIAIQRADWITPEKTVTLQQFELAWTPAQLWRKHRLQIDRLHLHTLDITFKQPDNTPLQLPAGLTLPFDLTLPDARIDTVQLNRGDLHVQLQPVAFALDYARQHYQLRGTVRSAWGDAQLQTQLADSKPYALTGQIGLSLHDGIRNYDADTRLSGTLAGIRLDSNGASGAAKAHIQAQLTPFAANPLTQAGMTISNLNPSALADTLPQALVNANVSIVANNAGNYTGTLHVVNRTPGSLDRHMLPVTQADANIDGTAANLALSNLMLAFGSNARLLGTGKWHNGGLQLHFDARQIDAHAFYQPLRTTRLNGKLDLDMNAQRQAISAALEQAGYRLNLTAAYRQQRLTVTTASLQAGSGTLAFNGELALTGSRQFSAQGKLTRFNPAQFGRYPVASINADFDTRGQIEPQLQTRLQLHIADSRYNNAALSGHAALLIAGQRLQNSNAQLRLGNNTLNLQGSFGAPRDRMTWQLKAPDIAVLGSGFGGKLAASGTLYGTFNQPAGELSAQGQQIALQPDVRIGQINAHIKIGQGNNPSIDANGKLRAFQAGAMRMDNAYLYASGTLQNHTLTLVAENNMIDLNTTLIGGWRNQAWSGQISRLSNGEPYPVVLHAPAQLVIGRGHVSLNHAEFGVANGTLKLDRFAYGPSGISSQGSASGIDLGYIQQRLHPGTQIADTLSVGGKWQFILDHELNGDISLWRERGDISISGIQTVHLGINRAQLSVQAEHNRIAAKLDASGTTLGNLSAQADTMLTHHNSKLAFSLLAPLQAHAQLQIPSLAWTTATFDDTFNLDGALQLRFDLQGSLHAPEFSGTINGSQLVLGYPEQGIRLQNGTLHAQFDHDSLNIAQLDFHAGGDLNAHGIVTLKDGKPDMQLNATARNLNLVNRPDRQITLSGQAAITARDHQLNTQADIAIDSAMLNLDNDGTPHLSSDVIVIGRNVNRSKTGNGSNDTPAWLIDSQIKIALGKHTRVKGQGLDARLEGNLKLDQHGSNLPAAHGTVTIAEGTYNAFGQRLDITRGILNFAGIVNNPGLDILATRANTTVTVGVQVSGTALAPNVKLVSTPELNDSEKLSWLVLGHGTTATGSNADTQALQAAASYLLGKSNAMPLQSKITELTGLNEISVKGSGTLDSSVLSLGKRLSDQLYLNYEQGLTGATQLVKITYNLSRRFSIRAQGGNASALDLFYTFQFD
jgi:translocation and assembly module TamB